MIRLNYIYVVGYDDWYALYYGDVLQTQGHAIEVEDILSLINTGNVAGAQMFSSEELYDWLVGDPGQGRFPDNLNDIPEELRL